MIYCLGNTARFMPITLVKQAILAYTRRSNFKHPNVRKKMNTATQTTETTTETLSFEDALKELEHIVGNLESGKAPLEDSISLYERGDRLRKHCEKKLADAQTKIEKISVNKDGSLSTAPLDEQE